MTTTGRKADWKEYSRLVSSRIVLSTLGNSAVSWDVMEAVGLGSSQHSEGQERKRLL